MTRENAQVASNCAGEGRPPTIAAKAPVASARRDARPSTSRSARRRRGCCRSYHTRTRRSAAAGELGAEGRHATTMRRVLAVAGVEIVVGDRVEHLAGRRGGGRFRHDTAELSPVSRKTAAASASFDAKCPQSHAATALLYSARARMNGSAAASPIADTVVAGVSAARHANAARRDDGSVMVGHSNVILRQ
jgi:hypothetical protein